MCATGARGRGRRTSTPTTASTRPRCSTPPCAPARGTRRAAARSRSSWPRSITRTRSAPSCASSERSALRDGLEKASTRKDELLERYLDQVYFGDRVLRHRCRRPAVLRHRARGARRAAGGDAGRAHPGSGGVRHPGRARRREGPTQPGAGNMEKRGWVDDKSLRAALARAGRGHRGSAGAGRGEGTAFRGVRVPPRGVGARRPRRLARVQPRQSVGQRRGYRIETTLDPKAYDAAEATVRGQLGLPEDPATAIVSVQPGNSAIRTLFAGLNFDRKFDVASQATPPAGLMVQTVRLSRCPSRRHRPSLDVRRLFSRGR